MNGFTWDDARRFNVSNVTRRGFDWALAVQRVAQTINNATQQLWANWNVNDGVGALNSVTFFNVTVGTKDNNTYVVAFQVQRHPHDTTREFDHLTRLNIVQTINAGDTVTDGKHTANLGNFGFLTKVLDLVFQDCRDFGCLDTHYPTSFIAF